MNEIELRQKNHAVTLEMREILDKAEANQRGLTPEEEARWKTLEKESRNLQDQIFAAPMDPIVGRRAFGDALGHAGRSSGPRLMDQNGREVRLVLPGESIMRGMDLDGFAPGELDLGRLIRAAVTGDWKHATAEMEAMRAMGGANDVLGGYAVPSILSAQIIDMARNQARVIQAGAASVPMESSELKLARIDQDPTAHWKAENASGTASDMNFGQIALHAKTLMALCKCSVELLEDSANLSQIVTAAISAALALELDRAALLGAGTGIEPSGLDGNDGINEVDLGTNGDQVEYSDFSTAYQKIQEANGPADGISVIAAPRTFGSIDRWTDKDGNPLQAPSSWEAMKKFSTTQIPITQTHGTAKDASTAYVGDFRQLWLGMRTNLIFEVSREAADSDSSAFKDLQIWLRAYLRADVAVVRPSWFTKITGIIP